MLADVIMVMMNPSDKAIDSVYSLLKYSQGMNRLILIDNASHNKTNIIRLSGLSDMMITLKSQTSLAGAWNTGLAYANTDYAVITNDDIIFTESWLPPLLRELESDKQLGYIQPYNTLGELPPDFPSNYIKKRNVDNIPDDNFVGCCFAIRRDMYNALKRYDRLKGDGDEYTWFYTPYYPVGPEDQDFIIRVENIGYKIKTAFDSYVHHFSSETTKQYGDNFNLIRQPSDELFIKRWGFAPEYKDFK